MIVLCLVAGFAASLALTPLCRKLAIRLGFVAKPRADRWHARPTALLGGVARKRDVDYSKGIAITSIFQPDPVTSVEPVRYPAGSSLMRFLAGPLIDAGSVPARLVKSIWNIVTHPIDFARTHILPGWAERSTILLVMVLAPLGRPRLNTLPIAAAIVRNGLTPGCE